MKAPKWKPAAASPHTLHHCCILVVDGGCGVVVVESLEVVMVEWGFEVVDLL